MLKEIKVKQNDGEFDKYLIDIADICCLQQNTFWNKTIIIMTNKEIVIADNDGVLYEEIKNLMCKYDDIVE